MKIQNLRSNKRQLKRKSDKNDLVNVKLDIICRCLSSSNHFIEFSHRYLQCKKSMPIRIIRLFIEKILCHSPLMQVSIYDGNNRLLADSVRLFSLKYTSVQTPSHHIPLRFTLINTTTSFGNCSCLTSDQYKSKIYSEISEENIEEILSTSLFVQKKSLAKNINEITNILTSTPTPVRKNTSDDEITNDKMLTREDKVCSQSCQYSQDDNKTENNATCSSNGAPLDLSLKYRHFPCL